MVRYVCRQKIKVNMKIIKSIFSKIFMTSLILGCVLVMPTWAAVSNGCDNPDNEAAMNTGILRHFIAVETDL